MSLYSNSIRYSIIAVSYSNTISNSKLELRFKVLRPYIYLLISHHCAYDYMVHRLIPHPFAIHIIAYCDFILPRTVVHIFVTRSNRLFSLNNGRRKCQIEAMGEGSVTYIWDSSLHSTPVMGSQ